MVELVDKLIKVGNPQSKVAPVFVALSQRNNNTKVICNRILCEWQVQLKMKAPNPKTNCPHYQPLVQSMMLRRFLSRMKKTWVADDIKTT